MSSALFSPYKLAGLELANRIVVSPMCQYSADDGCANDWHLMHLGMLAQFRRRAGGGGGDPCRAPRPHYPWLPGALLRRQRSRAGARGRAGAAHGHRQIRHPDRPFRPQGLGATSLGGRRRAQAGRRSVADHRRFADPVRARAGIRRAKSPKPTWTRVRDAFVSSAQRALRIGFDEIELHMAHGYLAHGFMSPISNKRTDQYGGSFENRLALSALDRARGARRRAEGRAARRAHHRQRLARGRADRRRRGGDLQGAQGRRASTSSASRPAASPATSAIRPSPATTCRLPRA